MNKPHVHAEVIKAWADGATIQILNYKGLWLDLPSPSGRPCHNFWPDSKYRVKPETVKYRVALVRGIYSPFATCYRLEESLTAERSKNFIRWLGEEQEVEI